MDVIVTLVVTAAFCVVLRNPLKKAPVVWYALAVLVVAALLAWSTGVAGLPWMRALVQPIQHGAVAFSLLAVVMLIGALPAGSKVDGWLRPVRGELSIVAFILCLGHVFVYLAPYATRVLSGSANATTLASFAVALASFVLLVVLGMTSIDAVKRHMRTVTWRKLQKLAYLFIGLTYAHVLLILAPSALSGGINAQASVAAYTAIIALYVVLRVSCALRGRRKETKARKGEEACNL